MADVKRLAKQELFGCLLQPNFANTGSPIVAGSNFYTIQWANAGNLIPDPAVNLDQMNVTAQSGTHFEIERAVISARSGLPRLPFSGTASVLNMAPFLYSSHFVAAEAVGTPFNKVITAGGLTAPIDFNGNGTKFFAWAVNQGASTDDNFILESAIVDSLNIVWDMNAEGTARLVSYDGVLVGNELNYEGTMDGNWTNDTPPTAQDFFNNTDTWAFITLDVDSVDLSGEFVRRVEYSVNNNVVASTSTVAGKANQYEIAPEYTMKVVLNWNAVTEKCMGDFQAKATVDANWSNDSGQALTDGKWTIDMPTGYLTSSPKIYEGDYLGVELNIRGYSTAAATPVTINYCDTVDWTF
jgi:hypothetical protein